MLKSIWKLIKILFIALIVFGIISMIVSLIVTFSLSAKMATEMSAQLTASHASPQQTHLLEMDIPDQGNMAPGTVLCWESFCLFFKRA